MLKSKLFSFIFIVFLVSLVACKPSEEALQLALTQTKTAQVTNTYTPEASVTLTPAPTLIPTFTLIPSFTPTNTLTLTSTPDTGVITMDSKDLMLDKEDLPSDAKYYLPGFNWKSPHHNSEVVSDYGVEEGTKYLEETGRIDGWIVNYARGANTVRAPEEVYQNIVQYKSAEGAYLAFSEYNAVIRFPYDYTMLDQEVLIGDSAFVFYSKEMQSNGENRVRYCVESVYRNYLSIVCGRGWEKEFDLDYVILIAEIAMEKIKSAPLGNW